MTTKEITNTGAKKRSVFMHNFWLNIKDQRRLMIIIGVLHLLAVPLVLCLLAHNITTGHGDSVDEGYGLLAIGTTGGAGLLGLVAAMGNFRYLYKKSEVDMTLALPISRRHKFLSDYLSGLLTYIVPFIAVQIISVVLLFIFHATLDGNDYIMNGQYINDVQRYYHCTIFGEVIAPYFMLLAGGIFVMILLYTITVLVMTCCGSLFESVIYTILINGMIPTVICVVAESLLDSLYGVYALYKIKNLLFFSSPVGAVIGLIVNISDRIAGMKNNSLIGLYFGIFIASLIYLALAYFIYMKRKAEHVGKPFVFKILYFFTISSIIICIALPMLEELKNNNTESFFPILILSAIIYLILEMAANRGLNGIWKGAIRYVLTVGLVFGFSILFTKTQGFGTVYTVPSASSVKKVAFVVESDFYDMDYQYSYTGLNEMMFNPELINDSQFMTFNDTDTIKLVNNLHKQFIDEYKGLYEKYGETLRNFDPQWDYQPTAIIYYLKNGQTITRRYSFMSVEAIQKLMELNANEEYTQERERIYAKNLLSMYDTYVELKNNNYNNGDFEPIINLWHCNSLRALTTDYEKNYDGVARSFNALDYPRSMYEELGIAYARDIASYGADRYKIGMAFNAKSFYSYSRFYIFDENFKNTCAVFQKYGIFDGNDFPEKINFSEVEIRKVMANSSIKIFSPEDYEECTGSTQITDMTYTSKFSTNKGLTNLHYVYDYSEDLLTLLEVSRTQYISDEKCYTILVNGDIVIVPAEYNDVAERVYNSSREYDKTVYEKGVADGLFDIQRYDENGNLISSY